MRRYFLKTSELIFKGILLVVLFFSQENVFSQGVVFNRDISPAEGWVKPQEKPFREEICLNGQWDFQPVAVPENWQQGTGIAPELSGPVDGKWENVKIKIPSPWNVNEWGGGSETGEGTNQPYSPSSVYYPSYPKSWGGVRMGWLRRTFSIPESWNGKRAIVHFEAVIGDFVVLVNGQKVGQHFGGYLPYELDITDYLKSGQKNELLVGVRDRRLFDKKSEQYRYFRTTYPPGSNTDRLIGIWQDVYLLAVPPVRVMDVFIKPWVDRNCLEVEVELVNQTQKNQKVSVSGPVKEWINKAGKDLLSAPEINWSLGEKAIEFPPVTVTLAPGEKKKTELKVLVNGKLKLWEPGAPNLYTFQLEIRRNNDVIDCKTERFGWRQLTIKGKDFYLNGKRVQCFADIQHPFGAYICSRRFAWAWYRMIQDFGGNSVRLHAQPWPRLYYDLADEMGLMVLDESALFGSSLALNFEEESTWQRTAEHLDALVMRDRNHPSVIGWSAGNELFAIAMYNKPPAELKKVWDDKIIELAKRPAMLDPTRAFITDDGDEDMNGNLPVWSKHFGHGLQLNRLPDNDKPLVIGECGATYYGKPSQLFPFSGEKAFESYDGRSEALAVDIYQNVVKMARPLLAYFSPSEVCWFGIEHMNMGYHDYSRLPKASDGIFAGLPYQESKPGYQIERIPPYVSTFNPGLDSALPLYKPLPMFNALKAALSAEKPLPCPWDSYVEHVAGPKPAFPAVTYNEAYFAGNMESVLAKSLIGFGLKITQNEKANLVIIDGENVSKPEMDKAAGIIERVKKAGGLIWVMLAENGPSPALVQMLPFNLELTSRPATSLQCNKENPLGKYFTLPDLYFSEMGRNATILKTGLDGDLVKHAEMVMEATNIDWSLFNNAGENRKCAQVVLYEHLQKPSGAALVCLPLEKSKLYVSSIDYKISADKTIQFWKDLGAAMGIKMNSEAGDSGSEVKKEHNLLMDGPVGQ